MIPSTEPSRPACAHPRAGDRGTVTFTSLAVAVLEAVARAPFTAPPPAAEFSPTPPQPAKSRTAHAAGGKRKRPSQSPVSFGHASLAHMGCQVERPTQAEIRQRCLEVQSRWSAQERESRSMWPAMRWELPVAIGIDSDR